MGTTSRWSPDLGLSGVYQTDSRDDAEQRCAKKFRPFANSPWHRKRGEDRSLPPSCVLTKREEQARLRESGGVRTLVECAESPFHDGTSWGRSKSRTRSRENHA